MQNYVFPYFKPFVAFALIDVFYPLCTLYAVKVFLPVPALCSFTYESSQTHQR